MSDLISRSKVNDVIDELEVYTSGRPNIMKVEISVLQLQRFINKLKNIPTAYEEDKVLKQLEDESKKCSICELPTCKEDESHCCYCNGLNKAIEIVKAGGMNNNSKTSD